LQLFDNILNFMITRERYLKQIEPFIDKPVIKVITGIRRYGKSTFIKQLINELTSKGVKESNILFVNKDSLEFDELKNFKKQKIKNTYLLMRFRK
jgi:uncharacterized protein